MKRLSKDEKRRNRSLPTRDTVMKIRAEVEATCRESMELLRYGGRAAIEKAREAYRVAIASSDQYAIARACLVVGHCHQEMGDDLGALRYYRSSAARVLHAAEPLARETRALALRGLAISQRTLGDVTASIQPLEESLEICRSLEGGRRVWGTLAELGTTYRSLGLMDKALEITLEALALAEKVADPATLPVAYLKVAEIYLDLEDWESSLSYYRTALELYSARDDVSGKGCVLGSIGAIHGKRGEYGLAEQYHRDALDAVRQTGVRHQEALALQNLGSHFKDTGNPTASLDYYRMAAELFGSLGCETDVLHCQTDIAELWLAIGEVDAAHESLVRIVEAVRGAEDQPLLIRAMGLLARAEEELGKTQGAFEHYREYVRLRDRYLAGIDHRTIASIEMRAERERMEREREEYRRRIELLEAKVRAGDVADTAAELARQRRGQMSDQVKSLMSGPISGDAHGILPEPGSNIDGWEDFQKRFDRLHPDFIRTLIERGPTLTPAELRVCALLRLGLPSKEIADVLCTASRTIDNHRHHIRRKLKLQEEINLITYLTSL